MRTALGVMLIVLVAAGTLSGAALRDPEDPLKPLGFLQGAWLETEEDGSVREELWSAARGTGIMGCFRWTLPNGAPRMLEMLSINRDKDDVVRLRLKHFTAELTPTGAEDKVYVFKLAESRKNLARFAAEGESTVSEVSYVLDGDVLRATVSFPAKDGKTREPLVFAMKRQ